MRSRQNPHRRDFVDHLKSSITISIASKVYRQFLGIATIVFGSADEKHQQGADPDEINAPTDSVTKITSSTVPSHRSPIAWVRAVTCVLDDHRIGLIRF